MSLSWKDLSLTAEGEASGTCACCGHPTRRVWCSLWDAEDALGVCFVTWTPGQPDHGAVFDVVIGAWGEGTTAADRAVARAEYRIAGDEGGHFGIVPVPDATFASMAALAGRRLSRADVIGTPLAPQLFAMCDAVFVRDPRLDEPRSWQ